MVGIVCNVQLHQIVNKCWISKWLYVPSVIWSPSSLTLPPSSPLLCPSPSLFPPSFLSLFLPLSLFLSPLYFKGLYPESHGIVSNRFYDRDLMEYFHIGSANQNDPKWWLAEPVCQLRVIMSEPVCQLNTREIVLISVHDLS